MTLEAKLKVIQEKLVGGNRNFPYESSISQGIVLPILQELNWDIFDTRVVRPEYLVSGKKLKGGRDKNWADFALFGDSDDPKVFIEVKKLDAPAEDGEAQVLDYAQKCAKKGAGVDIAVRTDGRTWSFYLPFVEGTHEDKRVFKLDLLDSSRSPQESSEILQRYLEYRRVDSGKAYKTALVIFLLEKYSDPNHQNHPRWLGVNKAIVQFKEDYSFLAKALEKDIKPKSAHQGDIDHDFVVHSLLRQEISQSPNGPTTHLAQSESGGQVSPPPSLEASEREQSAHRRRQGSAPGRARGGKVKVVIDGKGSSWQDQSDAMATVFKEFQKRDQNFYQKFYKHSQNQRKKGGGKHLARNLEELFGDPLSKRPKREISNDWVISTHYGWEVPGNKSSKKEIIRLAAEVAGLEFKEDISRKGIIVNLDTKT